LNSFGYALGIRKTILLEAARWRDHVDLLLTNCAAVRGMLGEGRRRGRPSTAVSRRKLLAALRLVPRARREQPAPLPGFSPGGFIDRWRKLVVDTSRGWLDRRGYVLAVARELRSALRSGRVWVSGSRRHADRAVTSCRASAGTKRESVCVGHSAAYRVGA
jgi:hypothetical protein